LDRRSTCVWLIYRLSVIPTENLVKKYFKSIMNSIWMHASCFVRLLYVNQTGQEPASVLRLQDNITFFQNRKSWPAMSKDVFSSKNFCFWYYSTFIFIWQILLNYELTKLKKFISRFIGKLYNYFLFSSIFNTSCMCCKIRCDWEY